MLVQSFKVSDNDPTKNSFVNYYMSLVKIQGFNALIDNKPFFDQPIKKTNKKHMKNLPKCQETINIQRKIY